MADRKDNVKWFQLMVIIAIGSSVLSAIWYKLEKIDDGLGQVKTDIAVIRKAIGEEDNTTTFLDRMFKSK